jgi:hypothetical protein
VLDYSDAPINIKEQVYTDDTDELRRFLRDSLELFLPRLLSEGRVAQGEFVAGSTAGDKGKSLRVALRGSRRGLWVDHATGEGGDAFALIQACMGCSFQDAIRIAREMRGMQLPKSQVKMRAEVKAKRDSMLDVQHVIRGCGHIELDNPAGRYLMSRSLQLPSSRDLLWHPRLMHWPTQTVHHGMVGIVRNAQDTIIGVHRTYLTEFGAKAFVEPVRMMLGEVKGGAVTLSNGMDGSLALCEGIETGLAVLQLQLFEGPLWACLSTSGLRAIEVPAYVKRVVIFADFDPPLADGYHAGKRPGTLAAEVLADRLTTEGRSVEIRYPAPGFKDFNCQLMGVKT